MGSRLTSCLLRMRAIVTVHKSKKPSPLAFTPHARGSTQGEQAREATQEVYPACAGIDPLATTEKEIVEMFTPHAGIDPADLCITVASLGLPRMRGDRP